MNFSELGLSEAIQKSLIDLNFLKPTPIQLKAIPHLLKSDEDLISLAQTGTGKTAAFGLPIIHKINVKNKTPIKRVKELNMYSKKKVCLRISK